MKLSKSVITLYLAVLFTFFTAPMVFAGNGHGVMDGTGPALTITDGVPVEISGIVADIGTPGSGMSIDTGSEIVTVFGIGPQKYWDAAGITRPEVGEEVVVSGYGITLSDGSSRIIATSIIVDGQTLELRDAETGAPLWRGMNNGGNCNTLRNNS